MKEVDKKDLPSVPGGSLTPEQSIHIGTCFPPFPAPVVDEPYVPVPDTTNTKL